MTLKATSNILGAAIALAGISMGVLGPFIIKEYNVLGLLPAMSVFLLINLILLYAITMTDDVVKPTALVMQRFYNQYPLQKFLIYFALVTLIFSTLVDYLFKYQVRASFAPENIAIYTSKLSAVSYTLTLLVELFYIKKILQRFGLLTFILQVPILIITIALAAVFKTNLLTISILWAAYNVVNLSVLDLSLQLLGNALPAEIRGISRLRAKGIGLFF